MKKLAIMMAAIFAFGTIGLVGCGKKEEGKKEGDKKENKKKDDKKGEKENKNKDKKQNK